MSRYPSWTFVDFEICSLGKHCFSISFSTLSVQINTIRWYYGSNSNLQNKKLGRSKDSCKFQNCHFPRVFYVYFGLRRPMCPLNVRNTHNTCISLFLNCLHGLFFWVTYLITNCSVQWQFFKIPVHVPVEHLTVDCFVLAASQRADLRASPRTLPNMVCKFYTPPWQPFFTFTNCISWALQVSWMQCLLMGIERSLNSPRHELSQRHKRN